RVECSSSGARRPGLVSSRLGTSHLGLRPSRMSDELHHECGVVAVYHLQGDEVSPLCPTQGPEEISRLMPRMLLDVQNRGQLSTGMTSYNPDRDQLLKTYRKLGTVSEAFRLNHKAKAESIQRS